MNIFAVAALPLINVDEWLTFCREAAEGDQADAHRQFLRRGGVTREHIFLQRTPAGALMLLVWGVSRRSSRPITWRVSWPTLRANINAICATASSPSSMASTRSNSYHRRRKRSRRSSRSHDGRNHKADCFPFTVGSACHHQVRNFERG
jgi:hypothetical protein